MKGVWADKNAFIYRVSWHTETEKVVPSQTVTDIKAAFSTMLDQMQ